MPLRPIDAIFVHQRDRHYVIYQNGELHKLTRMKLDATAWQRRTPYTGSPEEIVLARSQHISDDTLAQELQTFDLPETLHGRDLNFFKSWWRQNGYEWHQNHTLTNNTIPNQTQQPTQHTNQTQNTVVATQPITQPNKIVSPAPANVDPSTTPVSADTTTPPKNESIANTDNTDVDSLFDDMLAKLNDELEQK